MKKIKDVQDQLNKHIKNYEHFYGLQKERLTALLNEKEMDIADVDIEDLSAEIRQQVVKKFVKSGKMQALFEEKYTSEQFYRLESELMGMLGSFVGKEEKLHKHSRVIWLRENEKSRETYADYTLQGENYTLFAKVGMHQRSYLLWTEGYNYVSAYYDHLKDLRLNSFLPHNDRRFSIIHSSYLSLNPDVYKYLILRQKAWLNLLNSYHAWESSPIEAVMAFAYVFSRKAEKEGTVAPAIPDIKVPAKEAVEEMNVPNCGQEDNQICLLLDKTDKGLCLKLVIKLSLNKEEFAELVKRHDPSAIVNTGFTIHAEYGKDCFIADEQQTIGVAQVEAAFTFSKVKECMQKTKQSLTDTMRKNPALVTSDMDNGQFLQLFMDMCIHKMKLFRMKCEDSEKLLEKLHLILGPKIEKLRKDAVNLEIADLRQEIQTMAVMQDELTKWHKDISTRIGELKRQEETVEKMKTRDL